LIRPIPVAVDGSPAPCSSSAACWWLRSPRDETSLSKEPCELADRAGHELAPALERIPFRRAHVLVLALGAVGTLINAIEEYNVGLAAPLIAREWSLSHVQVGLLITLTFAGMAIGSDRRCHRGRVGRRVIYTYHFAPYTVGALLAAFSPTFGWLLVARLIVGIGLGGETNTALTLVAELMPIRSRGAAVATANVAGGGLGILASSALAALLVGPLKEAGGHAAAPAAGTPRGGGRRPLGRNTVEI
jgi:MFS family permease